MTLASHYPKADHLDALLAAMSRLKDAATGVTGLLQMGSWRDERGGRVFPIAVWESRDAARAAWGPLTSVTARVPFDEWEARPREFLALDGAV